MVMSALGSQSILDVKNSSTTLFGQRIPTLYPRVTQYTKDVFMIDSLGTNSHVENANKDVEETAADAQVYSKMAHRELMVPIIGMGQIGIFVVKFDVGSPDVSDQIRSLKNSFKGCRKVLICVNKIVNVSLPGSDDDDIKFFIETGIQLRKTCLRSKMNPNLANLSIL